MCLASPGENLFVGGKFVLVYADAILILTPTD